MEILKKFMEKTHVIIDLSKTIPQVLSFPPQRASERNID